MEKNISTSQQELVVSLTQLTRHIEAQSRAASEEEVGQWEGLRDEVDEETEALEELKTSQEEMTKNLNDTRGLLKDVGELTGNRHMQQAASKLGNVGGLFSRVTGRFGGSNKSQEQSGSRKSPAVFTPNQPTRTSARSPLPLPDPSMAPPQRSPNAWTPGREIPSGTRGRSPPEWGQRTIMILPPPNSVAVHTSPIRNVDITRQQKNVTEENTQPPKLPARCVSTPVIPSSSSAVPTWLESIEQPQLAHRSAKLVPPKLPPRPHTTIPQLPIMTTPTNPSSRTTSSGVAPTSIEEILALIPEDRRPTLDTCHSIDISRLSITKHSQSSNASSGNLSPTSSPRQSFSSVSSGSSKGAKPVPGPKPKYAAHREPGSGEAVTVPIGVSRVRQRAMELETTLRF